MTQEDKNLLLKDLCARLPYGVKLNNGLKLRSIDTLTQIVSCPGSDKKIDCIKPYLRPMSSMTEEEMKVLCNPAIELELKHLSLNSDGPSIASMASSTYQIDWLNAHHFDYRGLIEKGLAIEAPEGMYKTE